MMFFVWVIVAGLLQVTVLGDLNLLALLVVFAGLRKGPLAGTLVGSAVGAFAAIFSVSEFGLNTALYGLVGFASGIASVHIYYKENIFTEFLFSLFGLILFYLAHFILTDRIQLSVFYTVLISAMLSPVLFRIVEGK